jgi:hypothetical protein
MRRLPLVGQLFATLCSMALYAATRATRGFKAANLGSASSLILRANLSKSACGSCKVSAASTFAKRYPEFMHVKPPSEPRSKPIIPGQGKVTKQPTALDKAIKLFFFGEVSPSCY